MHTEVAEPGQELVGDAKIPLRILGVSLGRAQPNENVLAQIKRYSDACTKSEKCIIASGQTPVVIGK